MVCTLYVILKKAQKLLNIKEKIITAKQSETNPKFDNGKAIYLFNINKRFDLDGDFKFNTARLINHFATQIVKSLVKA